MSSSGEMKMSLRLMTCEGQYIYILLLQGMRMYIFMPQVLEQLELSVGPLGQDGRAERLHDLLDGDGLVCQLVFGGAAVSTVSLADMAMTWKSWDIYQTSPKAPMPTGCRSEYLRQSVISTLHLVCRIVDAPGGDLEGGAEYLGAHELRHGEDGRGTLRR